MVLSGVVRHTSTPPMGTLARLRSRLGFDGDWGPRHDPGPQQHATVAWECAVVGGWLGRVRFVHAALVHAPGRPPPRCAKTGTWQLVGMHTVLATGDLTTRLPHYTPHHSTLVRRGGACDGGGLGTAGAAGLDDARGCACGPWPCFGGMYREEEGGALRPAPLCSVR